MLTTANKAQFDAIHIEQIKEIKSSIDSLNLAMVSKVRKDGCILMDSFDSNDPRVRALINSSMNIFSKCRSYKEVLYMLIHYFQFELFATLDHLGPIMQNHKDSCPTLIELANHGILTINGQRATETQRSFLSFRIQYDPNDEDRIMQLWDTLYRQGINSTIESYSNGYPQYTFMITEGASEYCKVKVDHNAMMAANKDLGFVWVTGTITHVAIDNCFDYSFINFEEHDETYPYITACIWSQKWNDTQVDDILLEDWKNILSEISSSSLA